VITVRSGSWLTVTTGSDRTLNGQRFQEQRVNIVNDNPYGAKTLSNYLNPQAFAQPALGTFGNEERNSIRGPNYWSSDMALSRLVTFGKQNVELRLEAFNLTNNINWGNPNTTLNAGTFGQIRAMATAAEPRVLQFGVKYGF
jgi:hypothetical protein